MLKHTNFFTRQFLIFSLFLAPYFLSSQSTENYATISQNLLTQIMQGKSFQKEIDLLEKCSLNDLTNQLQTDQQKIAFWVNIYNSFIQISLSENAKLYENKGAFFSEKRVKIAGELLSFDDIEHGIIRKSRMKISLGYLRKWFRPKWERKLRVEKIDWRIHFALNCGAKSCPPVAIYSVENLDKQLDFMSKTYLAEQTTYNSETKTASSVALFSWFRGDFGGIKGAKDILFDYKITTEKPKNLDFKSYDWTLLLGNFRSIPN